MNIQAEEILGTLKSQWDSIPWEYLIFIYLGGTVFSFLNCFMGYKLRKVWGCILGLLAGGAAGAGGVYLYTHDELLAIAGGAAGALVLGVLAWFFYKFGVFVMCAGLVYGMILSLVEGGSGAAHIAGAVAGVFAGTLALGYERQLVIGITALCGGVGGIHLLLAATKVEAGLGEIILGLVLALLGGIVQASPFMRERDKKGNGFSFFGGRKKRGFLGGRKKKVVKKVTVQKYSPKERGFQEESPRVRGYREREEESRYEKQASPAAGSREDLEKTQVYQVGEGQYPGAKKSSSSPYMGQGIGVDLDDLNRELSQEIKKIYQEEE